MAQVGMLAHRPEQSILESPALRRFVPLARREAAADGDANRGLRNRTLALYFASREPIPKTAEIRALWKTITPSFRWVMSPEGVDGVRAALKGKGGSGSAGGSGGGFDVDRLDAGLVATLVGGAELIQRHALPALLGGASKGKAGGAGGAGGSGGGRKAFHVAAIDPAGPHCALALALLRSASNGAGEGVPLACTPWLPLLDA
jgi:hypothetical protein